MPDKRTNLKIPEDQTRMLETYANASTITVNKLGSIAIEVFIELVEAETLEVPPRVMMLRGLMKRAYFPRP